MARAFVAFCIVSCNSMLHGLSHYQSNHLQRIRYDAVRISTTAQNYYEIIGLVLFPIDCLHIEQQ